MGVSGEAVRRSGGRPTAEAAALLETTILTAATTAFLADGYAATTIEGIARACGVAKRTIYSRWNGKPALFRAVVEQLIAKWLAAMADWTATENLEAALHEAASGILGVALTAEAVALHRLLIAESARFPELPLMMGQAGANAGSSRVAALLDRAVNRGEIPPQDTAFAAEQFLHLVLTGPQRRALGLGSPLDAADLDVWQKNTVRLFLSGIKN